MKEVLNYLADRKLWHTKWYPDVVRHTIKSCECTVLRLGRTHSEIVRFSVSPINHAIGISAMP